LPTHPARARKLLRKGLAKVIRVVPFCIKLERRIENPVGSFTVGIDDGAKEVGIAVVNEVKKEVVFRGTIKLRQDVSRKIKQRAQLRRTRRCRKVRHRKARFKNRKQKTPQPSIRQRKESIVRVVCDLKKVLSKCPYYKIKLTKNADGLFAIKYSIDWKQLHYDEMFDGIYILKCNLPKEEYPMREVLRSYKGQSTIECCFGKLKGLPISVSPVWLHKPERIESLLFCVFKEKPGKKYSQREFHLELKVETSLS